MEGKEHRQTKNARVSIASRMSRRQPDGFLNVFIFSFQKDPSRENPSVLVPEETACPARNPRRMKSSGWKSQQGLSSATHVRSTVKLHRAEPVKGLLSFLPAWGRITSELSGPSSENRQTVWGRRHAGRILSFKVRFVIRSISITRELVRKCKFSAPLQTYQSETMGVGPTACCPTTPPGDFWYTISGVTSIESIVEN